MLGELLGRVLIAVKSVVNLAVIAITAFAEAVTLAVVETSKLSPKKGDAKMPWKKINSVYINLMEEGVNGELTWKAARHAKAKTNSFMMISLI